MRDYNKNQQVHRIAVHSLQNDDSIFNGPDGKAFCRISLITGKGLLQLKNSLIRIESPALLISTGIDFTWNPLTKKGQAYTCVIARSFIRHRCFDRISEFNLFSVNEPQLFTLKQEELQFLHSLFQNILNTQASTYTFKDELIQEQICVLLHTVLSRITSGNHPSSLTPFCQYADFEAIQFPIEARVLHFN